MTKFSLEPDEHMRWIYDVNHPDYGTDKAKDLRRRREYSLAHVWNPLTDDGDALRLAVNLNFSMDLFDNEIIVGYTPNCNDCDQVVEPVGNDPYAATRRAIVRAAAEIGKGMK